MGKYVFFFFQAEDGIRDVAVTGVQTCALPICERGAREGARDEPSDARVRPGGAPRRRPGALRWARRRRGRSDGGVMPQSPTPPTGLRVLVVDDEPGIRRLIQTSLRGWGYEVLAASTGEEALVILEREDAPALAILDWTMPGMDGLELCRRVRELPKPLKPYLIFVTARAGTQDIVTGLTAGADDYIVKPFQREELRARVRVGERLLELQAILADRRSEEHTSELQSRLHLVCRLLLEKKKKKK